MASSPGPAAFQRTETFPNEHLLWSPAQLHARLGDPNLALVDLRSTHLVLNGVIPGAAHFDLYGIGLTSTQDPLWDEFVNLMRSLLGLRGVGHDKTVVFYEQQSGIRAARAFWLLEYYGHRDVHVLDGGLDAWTAAGYALAREMAEPHPASFKIVPQKDLVIGADELNRRIRLGEILPLDTRSDDEYFGRNKRGTARGGAIPGAVHLEWTLYLDAQGRFKAPAELETLFRKAGITKDKAIAPY